MKTSPRDLLCKGRSHLTSVLVSACAALCVLDCGGFVRAHSPEPDYLPRNEVGVASWYGHPYHGRRAANGEIYDMGKLTAAHRMLPFGTLVRVRNLENDKSVNVRINDRGPFVEGRIIDLSRAAARDLGMQRAGTARVRLEVLSVPEEGSGNTFAVQVGAFRIRANAERLRAEMTRRYGYAAVVPRQGSPVLWRVVAGRYTSPEEARALAQQMRSDESDRLGPAFVQRLDD